MNCTSYTFFPFLFIDIMTQRWFSIYIGIFNNTQFSSDSNQSRFLDIARSHSRIMKYIFFQINLSPTTKFTKLVLITIIKLHKILIFNYESLESLNIKVLHISCISNLLIQSSLNTPLSALALKPGGRTHLIGG